MPIERNLSDADRWVFDAEVAGAFADMLDRSVPGLHDLRSLIGTFAGPVLRRGYGRVVEFGCSDGQMVPYVKADLRSYIGYDSSEAMIETAQDRFPDDQDRLTFEVADLAEGLPQHHHIDVILSVLTLSFIPVEIRPLLVRGAWRQLRAGGVLFVADKVVGSSAETEMMMRTQHELWKVSMGYTDEEVRRKRLALRGVLVPHTAREEERMLEVGGFGVECIWRHGNFAGWMCVKEPRS